MMVATTQEDIQMGTPIHEEVPAVERTVRIAVREIREYAFRAMVAHGACTSLAHAAAQQVLFAQVHYGTGFTELLDRLEQVPWGQPALDYERTRTPIGQQYQIDTRSKCDPLLHGTTLVELATAQAGNVVIAPGLDLNAGLLDAPMIASATRCGMTMIATKIAHPGDSGYDMRMATPNGNVGQTRLPASEFVPTIGANNATVIRTVDHTPGKTFPLRTAGELAQKRANTWASGLVVDAQLWAAVKAAAADYLVGDKNR